LESVTQNPSSDLTASLAKSPIGRCVPITGYDHRYDESYEVDAFVPDPLPVSVEFSSEVWMQVTDAATQLGRLDAAASLIPNPTLVSRIATRREAIGTSALEGTFANLTDLLAAEALPDPEEDADVPANVREVMNYRRSNRSSSEVLRATGRRPGRFGKSKCSSGHRTVA
jgi:hypothetical protein